MVPKTPYSTKKKTMTGLHRSTIKLGMGLLFFCGAVGVSFSSAPASAGLQSAESLQQAILALDKARYGVLEDHFKGAEVADASKADQEALLFLAYLESRIHYYCSQIYQEHGSGSLADLPCPTNRAGEPLKHPSDPIPGGSGQTSAEKVDQLEHQLNAALEEFDDMLLQEQEKIGAHTPRQREQSGAVAGSGGGPADSTSGTGQMSGGPQDGVRSPEREAGGAEGDTSMTDESRGGPTQGAGSGQTTASRLPPTKGPREVARDEDDVVARQLREAAEQETDPVVKERLWQEYRKYKEGIR